MSLFGRRERREIAELNAFIDRLRAQRDLFERERETAVYNRRQVLERNADLDAACRRLEGRNRALAKRLEAAQVGGGFDRTAARRAAQRIARLQKAVARARVEATEERAARKALQKRWDSTFGLDDDPAIAAGADWQDRREHHMRYDKPAVQEAS